jgi:hypothetical protein
MSATLKITHKAVGAEVRRGTYEIFADGKRSGSVEMNNSTEISVDPGITPFRFVLAASQAPFRPSTPPRVIPLRFDALESGSCRSFWHRLFFPGSH